MNTSMDFEEYEWMNRYNGYWIYNYDPFNKGVLEYPVVIKGPQKEKNKTVGINASWTYNDRGTRLHYNAVGRIRERNFYFHSVRTDGKEEVLTIFPLPSNYGFSVLWGVAVGTAGGYPTAFRVLWTTIRLSYDQVKAEYENMNAPIENSIILMDYDPDKLISTMAVSEPSTNGPNIVPIDAGAYEEKFLKSLDNNEGTD